MNRKAYYIIVRLFYFILYTNDTAAYHNIRNRS